MLGLQEHNVSFLTSWGKCPATFSALWDWWAWQLGKRLHCTVALIYSFWPWSLQKEACPGHPETDRSTESLQGSAGWRLSKRILKFSIPVVFLQQIPEFIPWWNIFGNIQTVCYESMKRTWILKSWGDAAVDCELQEDSRLCLETPYPHACLPRDPDHRRCSKHVRRMKMINLSRDVNYHSDARRRLLSTRGLFSRLFLTHVKVLKYYDGL